MRDFRVAPPAAVALTATVCGLLALALSGCTGRPFGITGLKVVASVDKRGQPGPEKTTFATGDHAVYLWFRFQGASPGTTAITVRMTHKGPDGVETTREQARDLSKPDGAAVCVLQPLGGQELAPGDYTAEVLGPGNAPLGPKTAFSVSEGAGAPVPAEAAEPAASPAPGGSPPVAGSAKGPTAPGTPAAGQPAAAAPGAPEAGSPAASFGAPGPKASAGMPPPAAGSPGAGPGAAASVTPPGNQQGARPGLGQMGMRRGGGSFDPERMFDRLDQNKDGKIERGELPEGARGERLIEADANKDGVITKEEFTEALKAMRPPGGGGRGMGGPKGPGTPGTSRAPSPGA